MHQLEYRRVAQLARLEAALRVAGGVVDVPRRRRVAIGVRIPDVIAH